MMLRTNLSTRPFYNERIARMLLGAAALVILGLTAFNVVQGIALGRQEAELSARATEARAEADRLRGDAARVTAQIDTGELDLVSSAAAEANDLIGRRTFSWGLLLSGIERALPDDVRVTSVVPRHDDGFVRLALAVEARRPEDLATFMERLETTRAFRNVLPLNQSRRDDGLYTATVEGVYLIPRPADPSGQTRDGEPEGESHE